LDNSHAISAWQLEKFSFSKFRDSEIQVVASGAQAKAAASEQVHDFSSRKGSSFK